MGGGGHCRSPQNRSRRPATSRGSKHRPSQPGTATSEFGASQVSPCPTRCREQPRRRLGESGRRDASRGQRDPVPAGTAFGALGVGRALPFPMSADPGGDRGHLRSAPLGQWHPCCVRSPSFWDDSTRKGPPPPREMSCPARGHSAVGRQGWGPAPDQHRAGAQNMASAVHRGPAGRAPGRNSSSTSPSRPPASWDPRAAQLGLQGPAGDGLRGALRARGCHHMGDTSKALGGGRDHL